MRFTLYTIKSFHTSYLFELYNFFMTYYAIKNKLTGRYPTKTYIQNENDSPSMLYRDNRALIVKVNYWNNQNKKDNMYLYPVDLQPFNQDLYEIVEFEVLI